MHTTPRTWCPVDPQKAHHNSQTNDDRPPRVPNSRRPFFTSGHVFMKVVGVGGFEPPTPCSRSRCANRAALHPDLPQFTWAFTCGHDNGPQLSNRGPPTRVEMYRSKMVGVTGFEPATTSTPRRCASGLRHTPTQEMVSHTGFEPVTSCSGGKRSIQLS